MITSLIFDLGGVVIPHRQDLMTYIIGETFHIGTENARDIWHRHKTRLLTGELPSREFLQTVIVETGSSASIHVLLEKWKTLYELEAQEVNKELVGIIDTLRKKYRVYLLTDTLDVHHAFNTSRGIYSHFDGAYYSHLEGKSKSQGESVFIDFLNKFKIRADECIFVDDMEAYIHAAESLGIHGILFTTNGEFLKQLSAILSVTAKT